MKRWLKRKLGITQLEVEVQLLRSDINKAYDFIRRATRIDADIGLTHRGNNTIILTGIYRNQGYVQFYDVGNGQFEDLVTRLREMKRFGEIRHIDAPPAMRACFNFEKDLT